MNDRVGIVVDGDGDYASLRRRLTNGYKILKTDGPRGHAAPIPQMVRKSRKQIDILQAFKCTRVLIVLDFETRTVIYGRFVTALRKAFVSHSFAIPIFVAVPNRMIENWFLADIEHLSKNRGFLRDGLTQKNYEGTHGKNELKKCMKQGISYSETKHGPKLFESIRFEIARENSASFRYFLKVARIVSGHATKSSGPE